MPACNVPVRRRLAVAVAAVGAAVLLTATVVAALAASFVLAVLLAARPAGAAVSRPVSVGPVVVRSVVSRPVSVGPVILGPVILGSVGSVAPRRTSPSFPNVDGLPASPFHWPLAPPVVVVRPFSPPPQQWQAGHRGIDLGASPGVRVLAAAPGVVTFAGSIAGTGIVTVQHAGGLRTTYQPLTPAVQVGDVVVAGQPVGTLVAGHAGCPVAACLHWGLRLGTMYLDPLSLLGLGRVRLLPLDGPP